MKVTLLLADAAQVAAGKLYVLGGGWSVMGPGPTPMAIALKVEVPWDQAEREHTWTLSLVDGDGRTMSAGPAGEALQLQGTFHTQRPPDLPAGVPLDVVLAVNLGPVAVPPDGRYVWQLFIDGETQDDWHVAFTSRPASAAAPG